jgi:hypothetical protein
MFPRPLKPPLLSASIKNGVQILSFGSSTSSHATTLPFISCHPYSSPVTPTHFSLPQIPSHILLLFHFSSLSPFACICLDGKQHRLFSLKQCFFFRNTIQNSVHSPWDHLVCMEKTLKKLFVTVSNTVHSKCWVLW